MDMTTDYSSDHERWSSAPSEIFERINDSHATRDAFAESDRDNKDGWDYFPGLLPA